MACVSIQRGKELQEDLEELLLVKKLTLAEAGMAMGVSRERVRQWVAHRPNLAHLGSKTRRAGRMREAGCAFKDAIASGSTPREALERAGVNRSTLKQWFEQNEPEYLPRLEELFPPPGSAKRRLAKAIVAFASVKKVTIRRAIRALVGEEGGSHQKVYAYARSEEARSVFGQTLPETRKRRRPEAEVVNAVQAVKALVQTGQMRLRAACLEFDLEAVTLRRRVTASEYAELVEKSREIPSQRHGVSPAIGGTSIPADVKEQHLRDLAEAMMRGVRMGLSLLGVSELLDYGYVHMLWYGAKAGCLEEARRISRENLASGRASLVREAMKRGDSEFVELRRRYLKARLAYAPWEAEGFVASVEAMLAEVKPDGPSLKSMSEQREMPWWAVRVVVNMKLRERGLDRQEFWRKGPVPVS